MKKLIFLFFLTFFFLPMIYANSIEIENNTNVSFEFEIQTTNGTSFCSTIINVPANTTISFSSPLDVPGLGGCASFSDEFVVLSGFCDPYDISLFSNTYYPSGQNQQIIGFGNLCNNGFPFYLIWTTNSGNAHILIQ